MFLKHFSHEKIKHLTFGDMKSKMSTQVVNFSVLTIDYRVISVNNFLGMYWLTVSILKKLAYGINI